MQGEGEGEEKPAPGTPSPPPSLPNQSLVGAHKVVTKSPFRGKTHIEVPGADMQKREAVEVVAL